MNVKKIIAVSSLSIIVGAGLFLGSRQHADTYIRDNVDALMNSEAYYLAVCKMPYFSGEKSYDQYICDMFTNEYRLYSCEVKESYISGLESKCVKD